MLLFVIVALVVAIGFFVFYVTSGNLCRAREFCCLVIAFTLLLIGTSLSASLAVLVMGFDLSAFIFFGLALYYLDEKRPILPPLKPLFKMIDIAVQKEKARRDVANS